MQSYQCFGFDSFSFDDQTGEVALRYSLDDSAHFIETLLLPAANELRDQNSKFKAALAALHLIGGISYYKTCLPKTLKVRSQPLTADQADFWKTLYENGLGEFFYRNTVDFRDLIHFPVTNTDQIIHKLRRSIDERSNDRKNKRVLVPIGGGKDSIVTIELLRAAGHDVTLLRMEPHPVIDALVKEIDLPMLTIKRTLDPQLFELNKQGALNGHVPITAYLSFAAVAVAILHGFDAVVMSNERSASYGNVEYLGSKINHQWSKGLTCERMMQRYIHEHIDESIEHFSLLRPLSELHIARMFTGFPQYLPLVTSCNTNWKILRQSRAGISVPESNTVARTSKTSVKPETYPKMGASIQPMLWCGSCPKCAFVFALLAAFVPQDQLTQVFSSKNLFNDISLLPLYRQLLGIEGSKPFECVGTPEEALSAFILAHEHGNFIETLAMNMALKDAHLPDDVNGMIEEQFTPSADHAIPAIFQPIIFT